MILGGPYPNAVTLTNLHVFTQAGTSIFHVCESLSGATIYGGNSVTNYASVSAGPSRTDFDTFVDGTLAAGEILFLQVTNNYSASDLTITVMGYE